jgi:predicted phosphodiesterase
MTLWALLSDVHGRGDRLARVLNDMHQQRAERVLALGDIGSPATLAALDRLGVLAVFGNWEASGLRGLPSPYRAWVARWPPVTFQEGFVAAHASLVWPDRLEISGVIEHLRTRGLHWSQLFPSMQHSDLGRSAAFAALQASGMSVFFHGHTHVQEAWRRLEGERAIRVSAVEAGGQPLVLEAADRWLVGIGSVGDPHDGPGACYALYDTAARLLTWRRV